MVLNEKGIIKQFSLVVYPIDIVVVIGDMEKDVNDLYAPNDEDCNWISAPPLSVGVRQYNVHTKASMQLCILLWSPTIENCEGHYICHDSGHAALELFNHIGATVDFENQEPFCYLLGAVYRLFTGAYNEYKGYLDNSKSKKKQKKK